MAREKVLGGVFQRLVEGAPIAVMARAVLERVFEATKLDRWFDKSKERQYTRELLFSSAFELMSLVAFKVFPTLHAAYQRQRESVGVSVVAVYDKIKRIEPKTSRAVVRETAAELADAIVGLKGARRPLLPGYRVKIVDGNCVEASEHRLKVLRNTSAGPLPGKSLVVYDPSLGLAIDVFPCEDGHAQERSLLGNVLETVEARDVWIADRNFCTTEFLERIQKRHARFIVRHHGGLPFKSLGSEVRIGAVERGTVFEQRIEVPGYLKEGKPRRYRRIRIELKRATRDGHKDLYILTNLSKSAAPAKRVADLYLHRWSIEKMFQELEAHLNSEVTTLGYPRAALFAFCIAVAAYNALAVIKASLRRIHGESVVETKVSGYYISGELTRCYDGMMLAAPPRSWARFRRMSENEFIAFLLRIARCVDLGRYRKHTRGPKKPRTKRTAYAGQPHVSTAQLLWARNQ